MDTQHLGGKNKSFEVEFGVYTEDHFKDNSNICW
jgi:hypothetical protein